MLIDYFKNFYGIDVATGAYKIEISLDTYIDVFNEWDPAPFKNRDLDPHFEEFIKDCSADIPMKYKIELSLCLPKEQYDPQKETIIKEGIVTSFQSNIEIINKNIRGMNKNSLVYSLTALVFLISAILLEPYSINSVFFSLLLQGLFIGGWVFLWEAFNIYFFIKGNIKNQRRVYKRLALSDIEFKYTS